MRRGETDSVMLSASTSVLTVLMVAGSFHFWHSGDLCPTFLQSQHLPFSVRCWWTWQPRRLFRRWVVGSYHLEKSTLEDGVSVMAVTGMDIARRGWKRAYEVSWIGSAAEGIVCARAEYGVYDWGIVGVGDQSCGSQNNGSLSEIHHKCTDQLVNDNKGAGGWGHDSNWSAEEVEQSPRIKRQKRQES